MNEKASAESNGTLYELLADSARRFGQKPAIHYSSGSLTFESLLREVDRAAQLFTQHGLGQGDRLVLLMPNSPAFIVSYFAAFKIGAVAVPLSTRWKASEMASVLSHCGARGAIVYSDFAATIMSAAQASGTEPLLISVSWDAAGSMDYSLSGAEWPRPAAESHPPMPRDAALILYTSGTTGSPKGVVLTHRNIISNVQACREAMPVSDEDVFLECLPMYHSFGFTVCVVLPIFLGASCVVLPGPKMELIAAAVKRFGVSVFVGIPALFGLLGRADDATISLFDSVRFFVSGAAPLSVSTIETFSRRCKGPLLEGYGLTEASPVASLNPYHGVRKAGSIGLPLPGVSVRVVDADGQNLAPDEIGQLVVKGPNVTCGYFADEAATKERLVDGWLYTGDMARIDADGYIYIVDRRDDMLLVQGANVYPHEIEDLISTIPGVLDVAVVGVEDSHSGKRPVAAVQCAEGAGLCEDAILGVCRRHLSGYKVPRQVVFVKALPLSPLGKPLRREVRMMLNKQ